MAQDLRDMLKDYKAEGPKLSKGHEARFEKRLDTAFPEGRSKNSSYFWLRIAASIVLFLGVGYFGFQSLNKENIDNQIVDTQNLDPATNSMISLGDLSPDLKKIEQFYTNGINVQLASLEKNPENEELINGYLTRLEELDKAYQSLNAELNEVGPSEATVTALIENLQLRLELLFKLKNKLNELKNLENETISDMQA